MNDLDVLRRMPPERAMKLAVGILDFLDFRPDLRRLYAPADLAFLENLASKQPVRYAFASGTNMVIPGEAHLAKMYASHLNAKLDAGQEVTTDELDDISEELADSGWVIDYCDGRWEAKEEPLKYERARAPRGGVTISGKHYKSGQFIPEAGVASLPAEQQATITGDVERRKASRASKTVDRGAIRERLKPHLQELDDDDRHAADKMLRSLQRHHEELAPHRLTELIEQSEAMLADAEDELTRGDITRRLSLLNHALQQTDAREMRREKEKKRALHKASMALQEFEQEPLTPEDVIGAASQWEAIKADYGDKAPVAVIRKAREIRDALEATDGK